MGAVLAGEELGFTAALLGAELDVRTVTAADARTAIEVAEALIATEQAFALVGGFGRDHAVALSRVAEQRRVLFLNIGASADSLRNERCARHTFHVEPSAAMYLDALAAWHVRAGMRRWFFVHERTEDGEALHRRAVWSLRERHFGAREAGRSVVSPGNRTFGAAITAIRRANPDVVVLLLDPEAQLAFLAQYESATLDVPVTGFPDAAAQTRAFFAAARGVAPQAGSGHRATAWEATLDSYGARELNSRFTARWNRPMEAPAWTAYQAVKILYEAALAKSTLNGPDLITHLENPQTVFDVWKGIAASFRPWDHQLRQSLYLVKISAQAQEALRVATLVGELPAIYMPGTDPVERLDQLGDRARDSRCRYEARR